MPCEIATVLGPEPPALPSALPGPCEVDQEVPHLWGVERVHAPCEAPHEPEEGTGAKVCSYSIQFSIHSPQACPDLFLRLIGSSVLINDPLVHCY